jgi:hypothetical protein
MVSVPSRMDLYICIDVDFGLHVYNLTEIRHHMRYCIAFEIWVRICNLPTEETRENVLLGGFQVPTLHLINRKYEFVNLLYKLYNVKWTVSFSVSGVTHDGA